jgi:transposase
MVRERTNRVHRLHKTLESANIQRARVATDLQGVSARAMLAAISVGNPAASEMAERARGRMRSKRTAWEAALTGRGKPHPRFILRALLSQIEGLEESIARFHHEIERRCAPFEKGGAHLDTLPGIGRVGAEAIVSQIGADRSPFPTAGPISAWAGVAPGNHQSAGKTLSRRTRQGHPNRKRVLLAAAQAAVKVKDSYLCAQYHRLVGRRGKKREIVAVAHAILVIAYPLIQRDQDYKERGGNYFDTRPPQRTAQNLGSRLQPLGYDVQLNSRTEAVAA